MVYLVLDLDRTVFIGVPEGKSCAVDEVRLKYDIHASHELKLIPTMGTLWNGTVESRANLFLINPDKLSQLIQAVRDRGGDVLILTAGCWHDSIRNILADYLDLTDKAADMLRQCHFHSAVTDAAFIKDSSLRDIQEMPKNKRLDHIIHHKPALAGERFVVLDDDEEHIESFEGRFLTETILFDPKEPTQYFYGAASRCIARLSCPDKLTQTAPIFFQQGIKRVREEESKENESNKCPRIDI